MSDDVDEFDDPPLDRVRLLSLSDGVFAIAITLLVLSINLPPGSVGTTGTIPFTAIIRTWPDVFSYVISFLVIANFWVDHRHIFRYVDKHTSSVTWINILFLVTVAFLPFPTSLLGDYGGRFPVVFYAASMAITGVVEYWLWSHVTRNETVLVSSIDPRQVKFDRMQFLATPIVFAVSIPVALFVTTSLAFVCWSSLFLLIPLLQRHYGVEESQ